MKSQKEWLQIEKGSRTEPRGAEMLRNQMVGKEPVKELKSDQRKSSEDSVSKGARDDELSELLRG